MCDRKYWWGIQKDDVVSVAKDDGITLTEEELEIIKSKIGNAFWDWTEGVRTVMHDVLEETRKKENIGEAIDRYTTTRPIHTEDDKTKLRFWLLDTGHDLDEVDDELDRLFGNLRD